MKYKSLFRLVLYAESLDSTREGAIGFNGYRFVFRDIKVIPNKFNVHYSSRLCSIGTMRRFLCEFGENSSPSIFYKYYDISSDLLYIGAIKTLVPSIKFDISDLLFEVWMLVKTPENRIFPATLYFGKSRLAIGGWNSNFRQLENKLKKLFNFNPFNLTEEERHTLSFSLESALRKVHVSDFDVIYRDEFGEYFLAVKEGVPIFRRIDEDENWPIKIISNKSWYYLDLFEDLIEKYLSLKDNIRIKNGLTLGEFRVLRKHLIERCYDELIELASKQNSRIAFQVLGSLLMEYNVELTDEVKKCILENSRWKDERYRLENKKDRIKRKKHLFEFIEKILLS